MTKDELEDYVGKYVVLEWEDEFRSPRKQNAAGVLDSLRDGYAVLDWGYAVPVGIIQGVTDTTPSA